MVRIKSRVERESSRPELRVPAAAPLPDLAGVVRSGDLGHESKNRKHRDVEKLTMISPRARTGSRGARSAPATENGGQWFLQKFSDAKRSVETTKTRERRLDEVTRTTRSSAGSLRRRSCSAVRLRPLRGSRRRFGTMLGQLLALGLE